MMTSNSSQPNRSKIYIAVLGTGSQCTETIAIAAHKVGEGIAKRGAVVVCGGIGGVFQNVFEGANCFGGETIAITEDDNTVDTVICNHAIATGMGTPRYSIIANTCSGGVVLGGWIGSLILMMNFLAKGYRKKPARMKITQAASCTQPR